MGWREQYERAKAALLADETICPENRALLEEFFAFEEYKLKRQNGLPDLDDGCYKTLYGYIIRLRNVNHWFGNKPWKDLTKEDIRRVYDGLEDGTIRNQRGEPFRDPAAYYRKVFKGKPFRLVGKDGLAREVIEFSAKKPRVVRFLTEETFRSLVSVVSNPKHLLLLWLAWDLGENIDSLLKLSRRDFMLQANRYSGEPEYVVNLPQAKLKRSRQSRSEPTLYPETARHAEMLLSRLLPDELIFPFGYRYANKLLRNAVQRCGATTMPNSEPLRWKDFRSGMACHLLRNGWTRDEVNARLGHTPHSEALDAYINFLALDRDRPKQRLLQGQADVLRSELAEARQAAQVMGNRFEREHQVATVLHDELRRTRQDLDELRRIIERLLASAAAPRVHVG